MLAALRPPLTNLGEVRRVNDTPRPHRNRPLCPGLMVPCKHVTCSANYACSPAGLPYPTPPSFILPLLALAAARCQSVVPFLCHQTTPWSCAFTHMLGFCLRYVCCRVNLLSVGKEKDEFGHQSEAEGDPPRGDRVALRCHEPREHHGTFCNPQ